MKFIRYCLGLLSVLTALVALLVGAVELSAFGSRSFYETQYDKLNVAETVGMSDEDLLDVTDHMLAYLQGKEDTLSVNTTMWGQKRDFFNDRERAHMVDVRNLNLRAVTVMKLCFVFSVLYLLLLFFSYHIRKGRPESGFFLILSRSVVFGIAAFLLLIGIGAIIVSTDFDHYWRVFHTIFFTNDLWLLDPSTDMLINIVPLGFFVALVTKCAVTFVVFMLILLIPAVVYLITRRKRIKKRKGPHFAPGFLILLAFLYVFSSFPASCLASDDIQALESAPVIEADSAILIDRNTGAVLYSKNAQKSEYPASTTKVMTALLTLENSSLDENVKFTKSAIYALTPGASHIGMTVGEELTVEQCLYGLLLPSANEVANALAEHVSGTMKTFVELMNSRALELGCVNTHFANPNGLHDSEHYTCAYDLALIFEACLEQPDFLTIDSSLTYTIGSTNLVDEKRPMKTTHKMLDPDSPYYDSRVVCGKTGHTPEAGGCLLTYASDSGTNLICVVLSDKQPSEYTDTKALLDYGFSSFTPASTLDLSSLFTKSSDNLSFYTSKQISPMIISEAYGVAAKNEPMDYTVEENEGKMSLKLSSGSLPLGALTLTAGTENENPLSYSGLPSSYLKPMEQKKESRLPLFILLTLFVLAVILVFLIIYNSKANVLKRRAKSTRFFKNVNLKNIKIK